MATRRSLRLVGEVEHERLALVQPRRAKGLPREALRRNRDETEDLLQQLIDAKRDIRKYLKGWCARRESNSQPHGS